MIKGHVKLDLCDGLTGKVKERVEGDNAFTDAINSLLNKCPCGADRGTLDGTMTTRPSVLNLVTTALGGIILFPRDVTSGTTTLYEPLSHQPTGYARYGAQDTSDSKTGSFNGVESGEITNGYRFVYDWSTSNGNGDIKTICLTNVYGGEAYGKKTAFGDRCLFSLPNLGTSARPLGWCGDYFYYTNIGVSTFGADAVIKRIKRPLSEILINQVAMLDANAETVYTNGSSSDYNGSRIGLDSVGNKLYILYGTSGNNKTLITVDLSDNTQTSTTLLNTEDVAPVTGSSGGYTFVVKRGDYLYFTKETRPSGSGAVTILKVDISNNVEPYVIPITTASTRGDLRLMTDTNEINGGGFIIGTDDTVYITETNSNYFFGNRYGVWQEAKNTGSEASGNACNSFQINPYYMATKYTLQSAVTKTAALTAKVTYEVTHV